MTRVSSSFPKPGRSLGPHVLASGLVTLAFALISVGEASAGQSLARGLTEPLFASTDTAIADLWLDRAKEAGNSIVRINVAWGHVAPSKPARSADPADPAYDFGGIDHAVRGAVAHGFTPVLTVYYAPAWAQGANRPGDASDGNWKPDPAALGTFAEALARRYSGAFGGLPQVRYFEAWNEPNLTEYLSPQWSGRTPVGAFRYRRMLNAFYAGVNRVNKRAKVIAGSTAPYGDDPPDAWRTRPLDFMRVVLCLKTRDIKANRCSNPAKFDIYAHHPINLEGGARDRPADSDDVVVSNFRAIPRMLRAAERERSIGTRGRHPVWVTELWWATNPPNSSHGVSVAKQARWLQESLHLLSKQGARAVNWFWMVDTPGDPASGLGLFFSDGRPKPSYTAFRFPLVTERLKGNEDDQVVAWSIPPVSGQLRIQRKQGGGWRTVARGRAVDGRPFQTTLRLPGSATLRAVVGDDASLSWRQGEPGGGGGGSGGGGKQQRRRATAGPAARAAASDPLLASYLESFGG